MFIALWASVGLVGYVLRDYVGLLRQVGGAILVFMGLHVAGVINVSALYREVRLPVGPMGGATMGFGPGGPQPTPSYGRSALLGVVFAAGWTPCIGPILGGIIGLASVSASVAEGTVLLVAYAAGLAIPFILVAVGATAVSHRLGWFARPPPAGLGRDRRDARRGRLPDDHEHVRPAVGSLRPARFLRSTRMSQTVRTPALPRAERDLGDDLDGGLAISPGDIGERLWHFFISMRTGLVLILALAVLGLIGTLLVQAPAGLASDPQAYAGWLESLRPKYGGWTDVFDTLGFFSIFSSIWFKGDRRPPDDEHPGLLREPGARISGSWRSIPGRT